MTEDHLRKLAAYRRTWNLIHRWKCPEGVDVTVVCWPKDAQVDLVFSSGGIEVSATNISLESDWEAAMILDGMCNHLMSRVVAAYKDREVAGKSDIIMDMTLAQAGRAFEEGLESALCKGKGGDR